MSTKNTADLSREWGLHIGDTIEGVEEWSNGNGDVTRLTLLARGETECFWRCVSRRKSYTNWSTPKEVTNWDLGFRVWKTIERAPNPVQKIREHLEFIGSMGKSLPFQQSIGKIRDYLDLLEGESPLHSDGNEL